MISHISIKDFAIIENTDIDLYPGLNIITGETGAGKSVIIEAVSMALGARADTTMVRAGSDKSIIQIVADVSKNGETQETIISREISSSGKSLGKVNGRILSLSELAKETGAIADIHGQYDHQSLLDKENHIHIIDSYSSDHIAPVKEKVSSLYCKYNEVKSNLHSLLKREADAARELDFIRFEVNEIDAANPKIGEDDELNENIRLLQNTEKIHDKLSESYSILQDISPSAIDQINSVMNALQDINELAVTFKDMNKSVSEAYYILSDLSDSIRTYLDNMDYSQKLLDESMERLDALERLKNKFGGTIESVLEFRDVSKSKLNEIENMDDSKKKLQEKLSEVTENLARESQTLSNLRKKAAEKLSERIKQELMELNFSNNDFEVKFSPVENIEESFSINGIDDVEFLLSANKGLPPLPLAKIASGGEMSRIMLAIKTVIGDYDNIPTMIFDEIDSGISGVTASIVGEKLHKMSERHQIICITHLPQIAAYADRHYVIRKNSDDHKTYTTVAEIDNDERIREIARLLGGKNITENTMANAKELIGMSETSDSERNSR